MYQIFIFQDDDHPPSWYFLILKFYRPLIRDASLYQISPKLPKRLLSDCKLFIFKTAAVRHLGYLNFGNSNGIDAFQSN